MSLFINKIVSVNDGQRLAVITSKFQYGQSTLYHARYLDTTTGNLKPCPRCKTKDDHTCPICGTNVDSKTSKSVPRHDLKFYVEHRFLSRQLYDKHLKSR